MGVGESTGGISNVQTHECFSENESNFLKSLSRETMDVDDVPYCAFQWHLDFVEDKEPSLVPVWIFIVGLLPNIYHEPFLRNIIAPIGSLLHRDNATRCATCTNGAWVCVLMDAANDPIPRLWIGVPHKEASFYVDIEYENLLAFYSNCNTQGHNLWTC